MVLKLLFMLLQPVLPSPIVNVCVVWDIMLGVNFLLCIEMIEKHGRSTGEFTKLSRE